MQDAANTAANALPWPPDFAERHGEEIKAIEKVGQIKDVPLLGVASSKADDTPDA